MPRRGFIAKRDVLPDPVYNSKIVTRLINNVMLDGKKGVAQKIVYDAFDIIKEKAVAYGIAFASVEEIDEFNILNATFLAMNRAIEALKLPADFALIDGNRVPKDIKIPCETVIKGDAKSSSIAAASVLAKVTRDRLMLTLDEQYPEYDFKKHKGYGTKDHRELIIKHGPCKIHRISFLKNILGERL